MRKILTAILLILFSSSAVAAKKSSGCTAKRSETKVANFGKSYMPFAPLAVGLIKKDWIGAALSQAYIHGTYPLNKKLERVFNTKRPCGCRGSFPSGHMIIYATSSSFLHYRYGWEYGVPAYVATAIFAADRVKNKAHRWSDMLGTFAAFNILTYLITPKFQPAAKVSQTHKHLPVDFKYLEYVEKNKIYMAPLLESSGKNLMAGLVIKF